VRTARGIIRPLRVGHTFFRSLLLPGRFRSDAGPSIQSPRWTWTTPPALQSWVGQFEE